MENPKGRSPMTMMAEVLETAAKERNALAAPERAEVNASQMADASHSDTHTLTVLRWLLAAINGDRKLGTEFRDCIQSDVC
jgi:uncharacterized membrane protein YebE (DUF533 family)